LKKIQTILNTNLKVIMTSNEETLNTIIPYWFPTAKYQPFWFDGSCDSHIKKHYSQLLALEEAGNFDNLTDSQQLLARIILLDQFTRNIYRGTATAYKNDSKALQLALNVLDNSFHTYPFHTYPLHQYIFILMPLRHTKQSAYLDRVRAHISTIQPQTPEEKQILTKFTKATLASYSPLEDTIETFRFDIPTNPYQSIQLVHSYSFTYNNTYNSILDTTCSTWEEYGIGSQKEVNATPLYKTIQKYFKSKNISSVAVSLSGGVDSMVILDICRHLRDLGDLKQVWAIHMEYVNREEDSPLETQFLKDFCQNFQIPIVVRKINYMRRDEVDREFYEEETRKARFATYKYMQREHQVQTFCLGHHYGDLGENVLMNVFKGRDILDLFVMSETAVQDGVHLSRPLLQHPKSDIYEYAEKNQIPYFKDTTPDWSCRGTIRRRIMPLLEEQWGECIHKTLAEVGKKSAEWDSVIETMVIRPFLNTVKQTTNSISFEVTEQLLEQPQVFWQRVLMELFHSKGSKMISNKNLTTMLEMLKKRYNSRDALKISLSNGWSGEFKKNQLTIYI